MSNNIIIEAGDIPDEFFSIMREAFGIPLANIFPMYAYAHKRDNPYVYLLHDVPDETVADLLDCNWNAIILQGDYD
jgi:hypothetical protein